jgi:hypothetical protein
MVESNGFPDFHDLPSKGIVDQAMPRWKRNKMKGYYGEVDAFDNANLITAPKAYEDGTSLSSSRSQERSNPPADALFHKFRTFVTTANPDGSATTRILVRCTLEDLSNATNLRPEDVAFALNECGLVQRRLRVRQPSNGVPHSAVGSNVNGNGTTSAESTRSSTAALMEEWDETIMITHEAIEAVARERNVKQMCMELSHVISY